MAKSKYPVEAVCPSCGGSGRVVRNKAGGSSVETCGQCGGSGRVKA